MGRLVVMVAGIVISIVSIQFLTAPYIWIFFSWFIVFLMMSKWSDKSLLKKLFYYLAFVPFTFGIFEACLWVSKKPEVWDKFSQASIIRNHEILGYVPQQNNAVAHRRYFKNELIFDVTYTIDSDGLRVSPPLKAGANQEAILFFGCSFTFGTGVNDKETMPYQVGLKLHGQYRICNFGFRGYGPHQMLSAIEHGMVERCIGKYKPKYAIYQALLGHIGRSAGLGFWDVYGPEYALDKDGSIHYNGHFDKRQFTVLAKSLIFRKVLIKKLSQLHFDRKYVDLFIEIIDSSRKKLETLYPGCEFHVIIWNDQRHHNNREVLDRLKEKKIKVHLVSGIFKDIAACGGQAKLKINPHDPHPTPFAHERIADYVIRQIIKKR